jgi:hypothetical protein
MALIVESGAVVAGADCYNSRAVFTAWAAAMGYDISAYDGTSQIDPAIRRGNAWLDREYRARFPGIRVSGRDQPMQWPRAGVVDAEGWDVPSITIPAEIIAAANEASYRELVSPGSLQPDVAAGGAVIKREKVGPLETEYAISGDTRATFDAIDAALAGLLTSSSMYSGTAVR